MIVSRGYRLSVYCKVFFSIVLSISSKKNASNAWFASLKTVAIQKVFLSHVAKYELGIVYKKQENYQKAEYYFLMAVEQEEDLWAKAHAAFQLSLLYINIYNDSKAKHYLKIAVEQDHCPGLKERAQQEDLAYRKLEMQTTDNY